MPFLFLLTLDHNHLENKCYDKQTDRSPLMSCAYHGFPQLDPCLFLTIHNCVTKNPLILTNKIHEKYEIHYTCNQHTYHIIASPWNKPAGKSNQLYKSSKPGCTAQAGTWLKSGSGGETFGVSCTLVLTAE